MQKFTQISSGIPRAYVNKNTVFSRQATRDFLLTKTNDCAYCGTKVIWFKNNGGILPDNFATIDHYYSKQTNKYYDEDNFVVLCCLKCNHEKNSQEIQKNSQEIQ